MKMWSLKQSIRQLASKNHQEDVSKCLLAEIDYQIHLTENLKHVEELKKKKRGVDYTWLSRQNNKVHYEISSIEKLQLQVLSKGVKRNQCSLIISIFRKNVFDDTPVTLIAHMMRCAIIEVLEMDKEENQATSKIRLRSLTWMANSFRNRVKPINRTNSVPILNL